jgi:hypothetical protein
MISKKNHKKKTKKIKGGSIFKTKHKKKISHSLKNRQQNLTNILKKYCSNSGNCLALGVYGDYIKLFFDDFRNLSNIDYLNLKKIGSDSNNGFIIEVPFKKDGYTSYAALKCINGADNDNLFYEYYVGKFFINKYLKKLPCFVETYDCYKFKNRISWAATYTDVKSNMISGKNISKRIERIEVNENDMSLFDMSCTNSELICILIQHFDKFYSFGDKFDQLNLDNMKYDYYYLWYQLYYALFCLNDNYTHYDLHDGNLFMYKPYDGKKYILMKYHSENNIYEFKSEYIVKIIDYGRNYFNNGKITTKEIVDYICNSQTCQPNCGEDYGYLSVATNTDSPEDWHWINPAEPNMSHDLRAVSKYAKYYVNNNDFSFLGLLPEYLEPQGTPENLNTTKDKIYNVYQMCEILEDIMNNNPNYYDNKYDSTWTMAATMEIFDDGRDYIFTVV